MLDREGSSKTAGEKAILVSVLLPGREFEDDPLNELEGLAVTAGAVVVGGMTQRREAPSPGAFLGSGKVEELEKLVSHFGADVVIFDNDLAPGQTRNLEKALGVKVLDRTELILDIFSTHAQTYESRLAVELAQLEYSLPRLKRMWTHLSRMKMGVGMRGPGEKQLETDRRLVEKRIHELKTELAEIERRKERQVASRQGRMTVSLVGYTNAGKSTLMNNLTNASVLAEDKLFATLDTRTRRWQLPNWGPVLLSDTVGFIRDLPHRLIASFKATLEEVHQADLLIHLCDGSNPAVRDQISSVYDVLKELDIEEKDTLLVINKTDVPGADVYVQSVLNRYPNAIPISAITSEGLERFAHAVSDSLSRTFKNVDIETGVDNGKLIAFCSAYGAVLSTSYSDDKVSIHCRMPERFLGQIVDPTVKVTYRDPVVPASGGMPLTPDDRYPNPGEAERLEDGVQCKNGDQVEVSSTTLPAKDMI
ncbi:MAG: GTPase HflX [Planctomycetota bacterium]|nr:GTPase HflX [Planctomycetota bacterium]